MRVKDERRAKAKTDSNVLTIQTLVGLAEMAKGNTPAAENPERMPITRTSLPLKITIIILMKDMDESANAYRAHDDPVDPGSDDGEGGPDYDDSQENDTFSSYVALDDVSVFEAAELDAIALLADIRDNALDPEVSAQLVQVHKAYLSFGKDKGKGKGKAKHKGQGRYPLRPSHQSLEDRRRRLKELKAKTECRACGRKGHWQMITNVQCLLQAHLHKITTRQQPANQANQAGVCLVLNEYSDDPDT